MKPRQLITPVIGLALCTTLALLTQRPATLAVAGDAGAGIRFAATALNSPPATAHHQRPVALGLQAIAPWISAVGAAVGVADLDGDGAETEACLVDPRDDSVRVLAVPGGPSTMEATLLPTPAPAEHTAPMGCVPADVDADGATDVIVYYWGRSPVIFLNRHAGASFTPQELVSPAALWNTTALSVADVDGDGQLDVMVGNYFPDGARVLDPGATLDQRMQMQDSMSRARNAGINRLFLGHSRPGEVSFRDASAAFPPDSAASWTLAFGAQDLTGNGLPDLYVANDFGPDQLLVNHSTPGRVDLREVRGRRDLVTAKSSVLGNDSFKGMGVTFTQTAPGPAPSIIVSNITTPYALHESNFVFEPAGDPATLLAGRLPYTQTAEARGMARSGWSWDLKAVDLDGDGREEIAQATGFVAGHTTRWPELQELAMANDGLLHLAGSWLKFGGDDDLSGHEPDRLWCPQPDGRYLDCAPLAGFASTAVARGLAVTDVDRDTRPDILVANQWADSQLFRNTTSSTDRHLWIRPLVPTENNGWRTAIGATISVDTPAGRQTRQLFPTNGHAGVTSGELIVGLDGADAAVPVELSWRDPNGQRHHTTIRLGAGHHSIELHNSGKAVER